MKLRSILQSIQNTSHKVWSYLIFRSSHLYHYKRTMLESVPRQAKLVTHALDQVSLSNRKKCNPSRGQLHWRTTSSWCSTMKISVKWYSLNLLSRRSLKGRGWPSSPTALHPACPVSALDEWTVFQ